MARKISWVSAIDASNDGQILELENKLSDFYANNKSYYSNIDYTATNWNNPKELAYQEIKKACATSDQICEFGCGAANILASDINIEARYTGCDFSAELMQKNKSKYPTATFNTIETPNLLPFADNSFDLLFSVFVFEHSTRPHVLLDECKRVLKKGGKLIIFCPDFLGRGGISSQQGGWSEGTPSQKIKKGKILDGLVTAYDNRVKVPRFCEQKIKEGAPQFLINVDPTVFYFKFRPDVDAVYVTFRDDFLSYLKADFEYQPNSLEMSDYEKSKKLLYMSFIKK
ncbi:MAG: methyltransferase domain-containing protein [Chitinophagaceae bacterium]